MAKTATKPKEESVSTDTAAETKENKEERREYTADEIQSLIDAAVAKAIGVPALVKDDELVTMLYIGGIAKGTTVALEGMGNIVGDGGMLTVTKKTFFSNLGATANLLLRKRHLIVIDGLTDDERSRYGLLYSEGELMSAAVYQKLLDYSAEDLAGIYRNLCAEHREIASRVIHSAFLENDSRVNPEKLKSVIRINRENGVKDSPLEGDLRALASDADID